MWRDLILRSGLMVFAIVCMLSVACERRAGIDRGAGRPSTRTSPGEPAATSSTEATTGTTAPRAAGSASLREEAIEAQRREALQRRAEDLLRRLGRDFQIRIHWPFVAASNTSPARFQAAFEQSLLQCYRCLMRDYFEAEPDAPIVVLLFRNDADYRRYARELFGDEPETPFGYYDPAERALVMNIATGTGTLIHELCHALIERDFPKCPTWLNEGLASLHEQCQWRDGHLVGLPNWRLPDLQRAIRSGKSLSLADLVAKTSASDFYTADKGLNYATARYLCQYLQHRGKLRLFYAQLKRRINEDPSGRKTLERLLALSLDEIESDWQRWVLDLRFDGW